MQHIHMYAFYFLVPDQRLSDQSSINVQEWAQQMIALFPKRLWVYFIYFYDPSIEHIKHISYCRLAESFPKSSWTSKYLNILLQTNCIKCVSPPAQGIGMINTVIIRLRAIHREFQH